MDKTATGNGSTGDYSTGNGSTGDCSTGGGSTGNGSTGDWSTGHRSTGNGSTGDWSTGNYSTGNWSTSNYSTGHFSTEDYSGFGCFDKPCTLEEWDAAYKPSWLYFDLTKWVPERDMTDEEKESNPTYDTTGGYLKVYDYKEAFQASYNEATREEQLKIKELPNFDTDKFYQISGIRIDEEPAPEEPKQTKPQLTYKRDIIYTRSDGIVFRKDEITYNGQFISVETLRLYSNLYKAWKGREFDE